MNARALLLFPVLALLWSPALFAQDEDDEPAGRKIVYKAKTEIDFEAVEVAGELVKPQGALLLDRKRASFNPLIKLRPDFNAEMDASVDEIK
ncbi:MAG: hypothetical protein JXB39_04775 [Deltaproteobacteria bacterium]|nr:hypothetical protein [Deltaproteobacteria bacterium]